MNEREIDTSFFGFDKQHFIFAGISAGLEVISPPMLLIRLLISIFDLITIAFYISWCLICVYAAQHWFFIVCSGYHRDSLVIENVQHKIIKFPCVICQHGSLNILTFCLFLDPLEHRAQWLRFDQWQLQ